MPRRIFLLVMPILLWACFFVLGQTVKAADVNADTTWTKENSPYIIENSVTVASGTTLIINQGVIVKFALGSSLIVNGKLYANGKSGDKIIFTSIKDDNAGGDTNGDGAGSAPSHGDWNQIIITSAADVNISQAEIKYGGGSGPMVNIATRPTYYVSPDRWNKVVIVNSLISFSKTYGIYDNGGQTVISKNTITGNKFYGIWMVPSSKNEISYNNIHDNGTVIIYNKPGWPPSYSYSGGGIRFTRNGSKLFIHYNNFFNNVLGFVNTTGVQVNIANNYWGSPLGPIVCSGYCVGVNGRDSIALVEGTAIYEPFLTEAYAPEPEPEEPDPVILVPGIMGSWNISGRWQLDPIFHTYDNLMEALIAAGYKEDSLSEPSPDLFTFPYDWRTDNNLTANLLKEKIRLVKEITGRNKVDIIAHSMGGLVARSYIEGSGYQNDIDQVIFLGTPHQGSPESYLKYEGAEFVEKWDWLKRYLFQIEAATQGYLNLTDYIRAKVLTVEQLLPVYSYLRDKLPDNSWQLRMYPLNYPQNNYLENLNSQTNINLLKQRVKITNIVGDLGTSSTLNFLRVIADPDATDNKWQSGYPEDLDKNLDSLEKGNGDSTVPLSSANSISGVEIIETNSSDHESLPTIMQKEIIKALIGKEPAGYFNSKITATIKRWAFFRVYSPVDFAVIAPGNKKIGKDFASSTEINQIQDAFYSGFNGHEEFVLIPNPQDGEYKVEVQGVDNGGEYTLASSLINDNNEITKEFSGNIMPGQERDFNITYSAASENPISDLEPIDTVPPVVVINKPLDGEEYPYSDNLVIDYTATDDFSGIANTKIILDGQEIITTMIKLSDYSLGRHSLVVQAADKAGNQAEAQVNFSIIDNVPPIVAINKPKEGEKYLHSDSLIIDYSAMDDFSGIATTAIILDDREITLTTINLFDYSLGWHSLIIMAVDKAGNRAQNQVNFEIIANIDSTIADLKEIYSRGWIINSDIFESLLDKMTKLILDQVKFFDKEQQTTQMLLLKTQDDKPLDPRKRQAIIEQYAKKLNIISRQKQEAINKALNLIIKFLEVIKKQSLINQQGYDIIINDINYLRTNL